MQHELFVGGELIELQIAAGGLEFGQDTGIQRIHQLMGRGKRDHRSAALPAMLFRHLFAQLFKFLLTFDQGENGAAIRVKLEAIQSDQPLTIAFLGGFDGEQFCRQARLDLLVIPVLIEQPHRASQHLQTAFLLALLLGEAHCLVEGSVFIRRAKHERVLLLTA